MPIGPSQFQVNQAWIVFKLNDEPIVTEADGDFTIIALMDAASCFLLCSELVPLSASGLSTLEAKRLLKGGWEHKQAYPQTLMIQADQATDELVREAERSGIAVSRVPNKQLAFFVREAREGFRQHVSRG